MTKDLRTFRNDRLTLKTVGSFIMATGYWFGVPDSLKIQINLIGAHLRLVGDDIGGNVLHHYGSL